MKGDIIVENEDDCAEFYANQMRLISSNNDFLLCLTRSYPTMKRSVVEKFLCRIYMSPKFAKSLSVALTKSVEEYEQKFGKVELDKEIMPLVDGKFEEGKEDSKK